MLRKLFLVVLMSGLGSSPALADTDTDIQTMINKLLPIAEELLIDHGEFFPFGGAMKDGGEVVTLSGIDGLNNDQPPAAEVINMLDLNLRIGVENDQYHATAVVVNVNVVPPGKTESTKAIAVTLDHREGFAMTLVFPYILRDGVVELGDLFAKSSDRKLFEQP